MRSPLGALLNRGPLPTTSSYQPRSLLGFGHRDTTTAQLEAMSGVGTLFAIVHRTSNAVSQVDWQLFRRARRPGAEREPVTSHLALDVLNRPNPFTTRQELMEATQQHVDLTGEGYWHVVPNEVGWPEELWPVRPDRMQPVPSREEFLAGYVYHAGGAEKIPLDPPEVIQFRMPNPTDPYRGLGPVQALLVDLDSAKAAAEWNRNFFQNSAEPGGIIEVPEYLDDTRFNELRDRWRDQHKGVANAHRVAILEKAVWKDRSYSMRDMQFVQLRGISREVIREAFGMPKFAVGDVDDVNRATADASAAWFGEQLTRPRLERIKGALNNDFLPLFPDGQAYEFDYVLALPEDQEAANATLTARANAARTLREAGWDPDDVLTVVGLPTMRPVLAPAGGAA